MTPAMAKLQEQQAQVQEVRKSEKRLDLKRNQVHPSLMAQPLTTKAKPIDQERRKPTTDLIETTESSSKINREKHIKLIENEEIYNLKEELNQLRSNITLGQLLDASPKLRSELVKMLRYEKPKVISAITKDEPTITIVNNIDHTYKSKTRQVEDEDLAMVKATIGNKDAKLLIDTCSNLNAITKSFLDTLDNYEELGPCQGRIRQAVQDSEMMSGVMVKLPVRIGSYSTECVFRVLENPDPFYDALIGLKTQAVNKMVVFPHANALKRLNEEGKNELLAYLDNNEEEETKLLCYINKDAKKTRKKMITKK
ncbi:hypothetical protein H8356DRAFT_1089387 [Neocallimastix lanati (nom. inval.)]|nr:hypothetical protein H8356DRAFT_1089387 [Neocallimastix sp. JGI-2020a]